MGIVVVVSELVPVSAITSWLKPLRTTGKNWEKAAWEIVNSIIRASGIVSFADVFFIIFAGVLKQLEKFNMKLRNVKKRITFSFGKNGVFFNTSINGNKKAAHESGSEYFS